MGVLAKRIASGMGANVFGQAVTVLLQVLSVPIFLAHWTSEEYGQWLMLSAVPAYFAMADVGLVAVAGNKMTMLTAQGKYVEANRIFQSSLAMTVWLLAIVFGVTSFIVAVVESDLMSDATNKLALLCLILLALVNIFSGLFDAVFRAVGKFAFGTYLLNFARLLEWGLGCLALVLGLYGFAGVAIGMLLGRFLALLFIWNYLRVRFSEFKWGVSDSDLSLVKEMIKPALAFIAFPVGNALSIQGMSLLVGNLFGPVALVVFNVYRTISRVLVQMITTVSRSAWPEITRLYGEGDHKRIARLCRVGTIATSTVTAVVGVLIYVYGEWILTRWTSGRVSYDNFLFGLLIGAALVTSFWQLSMVAMMATNRHEQLSHAYFLASIGVLPLTYMLADFFGFYSVGISLVLFELTMAALSYILLNNALKKDKVGG